MPSILNSPEVAPERAPAIRLCYSGSLEKYNSHDVTPAIGREFQDLQAKDLLNAPDSDALIRDLAILVSERGVIFLRNQDVDPLSMKELGERMSRLAGSVRTSYFVHRTFHCVARRTAKKVTSC